MDGSYHIDTALRAYVERIVNLHEDRDNINGDIREVYAEAKEAGFVTAMLRQMVKEQRMDGEARNAMYQLQEEYRIKLGMLTGTPLGEAAIERAVVGTVERAVDRPTPFAEQPVHEPRRRGRPRKAQAEDALDKAKAHLGGTTGSRPMFDA